MDDVVYEYKAGVTHGFETFRRYRQQNRVGWFASIKMILMVLLFAFGCYGVYIKVPGVAMFAWGLLLLFPFALYLNMLGIMLSVRRLQPFNSQMRAVLDRSGFTISRKKKTSTFGWGEFKRSAGFPDGLILVRGSRECFWLPDAALKSSSGSHARELVRQSVPIFKELGSRSET